MSKLQGASAHPEVTQHPAPEILLPRRTVEKQAGISRATIYRMIKAGKFPPPVALGGGSVRWRQSSITEWQQSLTKTVGA